MKTLEERLWAKVDKTDACWLWTGARDGHGHGAISRGRRDEGLLKPHRVAYELVVGPIPEGLDLDHLCRVRHCVNPAHLEAVTRQVNLLRGDRKTKIVNCPQGHPYDTENTYVMPDGGRACRACRREWRRRYRKRQAAAR